MSLIVYAFFSSIHISYSSQAWPFDYILIFFNCQAQIQVQVRWGSERSESGKVKLRELKTQKFGHEPYNKFGFAPTLPPTATTIFFLAWKGPTQVKSTKGGLVWLKYGQRRVGLEGGHQEELQEGHHREYFGEYFMELKFSDGLRNGKGGFQLKFKGSTFSTWHFKVEFTPYNSKVKSHVKFIWAWH